MGEAPEGVGAAARRTGRMAAVPSVRDVSCFLIQLRSPTRVSAIRAVIDGAFVTFTLKKRGVQSLFAASPPAGATVDLERSQKVSAAVDAGFNLIPVAPTCLRRSVTLLRELNRLNLASVMHVGVRTVGDRVDAHAWVQVGDVVVNDDPSVTGEYEELVAGQLDAFIPRLR